MSMSSSWDDFSYDDDDELLDSGVDSEFVAADENDDASVKAAAGASLEAPEVDWFGEVIDVPQGTIRIVHVHVSTSTYVCLWLLCNVYHMEFRACAYDVCTNIVHSLKVIRVVL